MPANPLELALNNYATCCGRIEHTKANLLQMLKQSSRHDAAGDIRKSDERYAGFREEARSLRHFTAEAASLWYRTAPNVVNEAHFTEMRALESQIQLLEAEKDRNVQWIVEYCPACSYEASIKIRFLVSYMITHQAVEYDYFLFLILESAQALDGRGDLTDDKA